MYNFGLNKEQIVKFLKWDKKHKVCKLVNLGAIGGRLEFTFIPTGIGPIAKVKCAVCMKEIDLTDSDS